MLGNPNGKLMKGWLGTRTTIKSPYNEGFHAALSSLTAAAQSSDHDG